MKCPNDETLLVMSDRQGIEIDYCPQCRGVWLDRGELDKIIERSLDAPANPAPQNNYQAPPQQTQYDSRNDHRSPYSDNYQNKKRKKEGFLGDLFDF